MCAAVSQPNLRLLRPDTAAAARPPTRWAVALTGCLAVAAPSIAAAAVFPVTPGATADLPDAVPGNGVCLTSAGNCTLRAAIQEANAFGGSDRIEVPEGVYLLTLAGAGEDQAATGDLDITEDVDLVGIGPGSKIVDGNGFDRVFDLHGVPAMIEGLTIRGGNAAQATFPGFLGGGVLARSGSNLDLSRCELEANRANAGGGLYVQAGAVVTVTGCRLVQNTAAALGFALAEGGAVFSAGDLDLDRCEVSSNTAAVTAGAVFSRGATAVSVRNTTISGNLDNGLGSDDTEVDLVNSTLTGNASFALSVVSSGGNTLTVRNSILAASGASDCSIVGIAAGNLDFAGEHNLASDTSCPNDGGTVDLPNTDPALGPLRFAGGATRVHVPLVGSPVVDAGNDARCEPDDQRGASRPLDGATGGVPAAVCDIGAVEVLPCVDDPDELVSGSMIDTSTEFVACFTITAGPAVDVLGGAQLTLRARDEVRFDNGVSIVDGSLIVHLDPAAGSGIVLP